MALTPQKQRAIDELIRKAIGPKRAVVKVIGSRYNSKKWSNYQFHPLDDGHTVFVNLDREPNTAYVSEKPNAMHFGRYKRSEEREERRLAKKVAKEAKAKTVKAEPKKGGN